MEKTKILHLITRLDEGGSAENTLLTVAGLDKSRWDVSVMSGPVDPSHHDRQAEVLELGAEYVLLPELTRDIHLLQDCRAFVKVFRYLRKEKFTIVHTHTSKAGFLGRLAARLAGVPVTVHTPHGHVFFGYFGFLKTRIFTLLEKLAARLTDRLIALTDNEKKDYLKHKVGRPQKWDVILSGVELDGLQELSLPEKRNLKASLRIPPDACVVGAAGRLVPVKGFRYLIEAAGGVLRKHPRTVFLLAGDGELKTELLNSAGELGIQEKVFFLGWREDLAKIISLFDILVVPSLNEGMGRVLVEAMALGKPVVASDVCGIPDLVVHGKNGFLFPPRNSGKLAECILSLINDKAQRERLGEAGRDTARNFASSAMVEKIESLYRNLLTQRFPGGRS